MDSIVEQFVSAVRTAYPVSVAENLRSQRPDLVGSLKLWDTERSEFESKHSVRYPKIARDIFAHCAETFVFFKSPTYRHLTLPLSASTALDTMLEFADDASFYRNKIPIFDADGNYDLLDLDQYDAATDDCPVIFDNHEAPDEHPEICKSFRNYLRFVTLEIQRGDNRNDYSLTEYLSRMKKRGTLGIQLLAET